MSYILGKDDGMFNPALRFAFTNITSEDFVSAWGGSEIRVKAGETIELPHHLANKLTDELVDKIMIGNAKLDEIEYYKNNPNTRPLEYRSPSQLGVPAARRVWEDQIVRELEVDEESPEIQVMRAQIREEVLNDLKAESSSAPVQAPTSLSEFAELGKDKSVEKEAKKPPMRTKKIKLTNEITKSDTK